MICQLATRFQSALTELIDFFINLTLDINSINRNQETALYLAITRKEDDIVKKLLAKNANPNISDDQKTSPLHLSCINGNVSITQLLIDKGADIFAQDCAGNIPFHRSINKELSQLFLQLGLDINTPDTHGNTSLHFACRLHNLELVQFLVTNNADINIQNNEGNSPLHMASGCDYPEIVNYLISHNANINLQNNLGDTPLHDACDWSCIQNMQALLLNKPNIDIKNKKDLNVLEFLVKHKQYDLLALIESYKNYEELSQSISSSNEYQTTKKLKI